MKIPNDAFMGEEESISLARIVSEDSQLLLVVVLMRVKSSKDS